MENLYHHVASRQPFQCSHIHNVALAGAFNAFPLQSQHLLQHVLVLIGSVPTFRSWSSNRDFTQPRHLQ